MAPEVIKKSYVRCRLNRRCGVGLWYIDTPQVPSLFPSFSLSSLVSRFSVICHLFESFIELIVIPARYSILNHLPTSQIFDPESSACLPDIRS